MHSVKCDRYRKVSGALLFPSLYENNPSISQKSFIGNGIPLWIANNNRFAKMDDNLPLKFLLILLLLVIMEDLTFLYL